jgi:hypothetical protein
MKKHLPLATAILALGSLAPSAVADDGKPAQAGKTQTTAEVGVPAKKSGASQAPAEAPQETLKKALKQIQAMADNAAKSERSFEMPSPNMFAMRLSKDLEADAERAIGRAFAKLGSIADARTTWQAALDATTAISSINTSEERAQLYTAIARAQNEAGEQSEARLSLRQAGQAARAISSDFRLRFTPPPGMESMLDHVGKKATALQKIAQLLAEMGDQAASEDAFRLAIETADSIKEPLSRVRRLLEIAQAGRGEAAKGLWQKCIDLALALQEEHPRAKAVEAVLRARLLALPADETVAIVADRLKGDLQHYALWIVADAIAASDKPVAKQTLARLSQLASQAEFDRPSKKIKVYERIAEAQARIGDYDGAYLTAGQPEPVNNIQTFRATQARAHVMRAIAAAQLQAKERDAAKQTVQLALEMISPLPAEDAEAYYPLAELCMLQARAGDLAGALQTANAVSSSQQKVSILTEIAAAHAEANRPDEAKKTLLLARDAARSAPNDALWLFTANTSEARRLFDQSDDPSVSVQATLAGALARLGDLDAALKTVSGISQSSFGSFARKQAIEQIVQTRLDKADVAGARRTAELVSDSDAFMNSKPELLEKIAKRQAELGDAAGVLAWAGDQKLPKAKLQALRGLADGIVQRIEAQKPKSPATAATPKGVN